MFCLVVDEPEDLKVGGTDAVHFGRLPASHPHRSELRDVAARTRTANSSRVHLSPSDDDLRSRVLSLRLLPTVLLASFPP